MMMRCASRRLRGRMLNRKDFSGISEQLMECEGPVTASCEGAWPGAACAWQHGKGFATAASPDEKPPILAHAIGEFSKFDPEKQSARYVPEGEEARGLMAQLQELAGRDERFDSVARVSKNK